MIYSRRLIVFITALAALSSCKPSNAPVASSSTPSDISSSAQVVKAFGHFIPAGAPQANIELVISPGFHINANPATFSYLIATEVQPVKVEGVTIPDKLTYPQPKMEKFAFEEQPLAVYEGSVTIPIPLTAEPDAKGQRTIPFKIRVQACDKEKCYPPATVDAALVFDLGSLKR
ncbi:MAG TPA: protein-disulfide reductase DsbD domain-containing protein [Pyrinomonadaceae bacterium]|jgi:DsbC/DsbD-like thiol-disulfide interchange protein|nr:protein-disulfide reductase DsbD domain-containing protein [Pyrinomonadaceae bacterium]